MQEQRPFSRRTQHRFQKLMRLATESPYSGERDNARVAAHRLAESHGMSLDEAARAAVKSNSSPLPEPGPENGPEVDGGTGRWQTHRTYWDQGHGGSHEGPNTDWLHEYARLLREQRKYTESEDRSQLLWLVFLICAIFAVFGGVAFTLGKVADFFRLVLTGT